MTTHYAGHKCFTVVCNGVKIKQAFPQSSHWDFNPIPFILEGANSIRETKFAEVIAVGYDVKKVRVGQRIILDWSKCYPVKLGDVERAIIDEENILATYSD